MEQIVTSRSRSVGAGSEPANSGAEASWQSVLKGAVRDADELCRRLGLPPQLGRAAGPAAGDFPVFVPEPFLLRMRRGDPRDPLLLQVLPTSDEMESAPGFSPDPVGDGPARRAPGLIHKYAGRVLLITTGACAVHCRYCFRRHYPYHESPRGLEAWEAPLDIIRQDSSIQEVLLSGGDPLTLVDEQLAALADALAAIPHLRRLRIHTRLPIMIPQRVNDEMLAWLCGTRLQPYVVIHANHAAELDEDVARALGRMADRGVTLLNQAVLLQGINNDVQSQVDLARRLLDCRVLPYYLHQLDRVAGAAHFETESHVGTQLIEEMARQLPGYAVPRFVREEAGAESKVFLA